RKRPWFLRAMVLGGFLPYLAVWTGWWTREVGRQPWIVYNIMRTYEGVSHMGLGEEIAWFAGYVVFELTVWAGAWYFFSRVIRKGPDLESPLPGAPEQYADQEDAGGGLAKPIFAKPSFGKSY
ncbi:cytochrome ubiquinol oxidase subunit I, partial [Acidithiobacillus ferridurans]